MENINSLPDADLFYEVWGRLPRWLLIALRAYGKMTPSYWHNRRDISVQERLRILDRLIAEKKHRK